MANWVGFTINFIDRGRPLLLELSVYLRGEENEKKMVLMCFLRGEEKEKIFISLTLTSAQKKQIFFTVVLTAYG